MATYLDGQLVIADDLLLVQKLNMLTGGPITTPAAVDLSLVPGAGGITKVGAGTPGHLGTPTNDDFFAAGRAEIDGPAFFDNTTLFAGSSTHASNVLLNDGVKAYFGTSADAALRWNIVQTPHTLMMTLGLDSRALVICESGDDGVDFANALKVDPTLIIQSGDATVVAGRVLHYHDRTDGVAETELGDYLIKTPANKTLRLDTVVYEDYIVSLTRGLSGALKPPTLTKFQDDGGGSVGLYAWAFGNEGVAGNEQQMWFEAELPHGYREGTDVGAHIHWSPAAGGAAGEFVKWGLEYRWENIDGTFGNTTIITSDASAAATATTSADASMVTSKNYQTRIGTITGSGKTVSSSLLCRIFRNSSDGDDTLAQSAIGLRVGFHYQVDTMGSRLELTK